MSTKTKKKGCIRQGDVLLIPTTREIPASANPIPREARGRNKCVVLAHGEITGHAHSVEAPDATFFDLGGIRVLDVPVAGGVLLHEVQGRPIEPVEHYDHSLVAGRYEVRIQHFNDGEWVRQAQD